jgi:drug/metabolite transporter (DMT)-like permease
MGEQIQSRTENINDISLPVNCKESCTHICRSRWKIVLLGQAVALVAAIANACSFTLVYNLQVQLPVTELFLLYMTLMIIHLRSFQGPRNNRLETDDSDHRRPMYKFPGTSLDLCAPWWSYGLISLLDVLANSATILSFRYTSLVSTSLLGSLTIPSVMLISWVGFHRHFSLYHFVGAALCLVGGTMTLLLDSNQDKSSVTLNVDE